MRTCNRGHWQEVSGGPEQEEALGKKQPMSHPLPSCPSSYSLLVQGPGRGSGSWTLVQTGEGFGFWGSRPVTQEQHPSICPAHIRHQNPFPWLSWPLGVLEGTW